MPDGLDDLLTLDDVLALVRPPWHADAACREHPELTWFPERGQPTEPAKTVCAGCLVATECRSAGIDGRELGIWGGLSERNRRQLRQDAQRGQAAA